MKHMVHDETVCGPLCQHPMCWQSIRRQERGLPRCVERRSSKSDEDEELPTLKMYNMLGEYGEHEMDRYPASCDGRPSHRRGYTSIPRIHKTVGVKPAATGITTQGTRHLLSHSAPSISMKQGVVSKIKKVEVQELFEVEDLRAAWKDTFQSKSYYVWVPNAKKHTHTRPLLDPMQNVQVKDIMKAPQPLNVRDVTESMVPKTVIQQREPENKKCRKRSRKSPTGGQPYLSPRPARTVPATDLELLLELLDMPKDVLAKIPENDRERRLLSKENLRDMLIKLATHLPQDAASLAMATGNVLLQSKMDILDGKTMVQNKYDFVTTSQVYLMEKEGIIERLSSLHESVCSQDGEQSTQQQLNKKKPLPSISDRQGQMTSRGKVPSISLGLPEIPPGSRETKTFTYYKKQAVDFTIGPVEDVEGAHDTPKSETIHVNVPSASGYDSRSMSPISPSPRHLSEVDTTTPSSKRRSAEPRQLAPLHNITPSDSTPQVPGTPHASPATRTSVAPTTPDTKGSPRSKASQPTPTVAPLARPPVRVPVGEVIDVFGPLPALQVKTPDNAGLHPIKEDSHMTEQSPKTGQSETGQESLAGTEHLKYPPQTPKYPPQTPGQRQQETLSKQSKRSVHFAPDVAMSLDGSRTSSPRPAFNGTRTPSREHSSSKWTSREGTEISIDNKTLEPQFFVIQKNKLSRSSDASTPPSIPRPMTIESSVMVIGSRTGPSMTTTPYRYSSPHYGHVSATPEPPWPHVDEDDYDQEDETATETKSTTTTASKEIVSSRLVNVDGKSDRTNLSSMMPESRESARSELAKRILEESVKVEDSPGPPPPSPDWTKENVNIFNSPDKNINSVSNDLSKDPAEAISSPDKNITLESHDEDIAMDSHDPDLTLETKNIAVEENTNNNDLDEALQVVGNATSGEKHEKHYAVSNDNDELSKMPIEDDMNYIDGKISALPPSIMTEDSRVTTPTIENLSAINTKENTETKRPSNMTSDLENLENLNLDRDTMTTELQEEIAKLS